MAQNPRIYYDAEWGRHSFNRDKQLVKSSKGDVVAAYYQRPGTQVSNAERAAYLGEDISSLPQERWQDLVTLTTVCGVEYRVAGVRLAEMIGRFHNVVPSCIGARQRDGEFRAGRIMDDVLNQFALRLEEIWSSLSLWKRKLTAVLPDGTVVVVDGKLLRSLKNDHLPDEIALLSDDYSDAIKGPYPVRLV